LKLDSEALCSLLLDVKLGQLAAVEEQNSLVKLLIHDLEEVLGEGGSVEMGAVSHVQVLCPSYLFTAVL